MRRGGRNPNQNPGVRPVEKIELPEKSSKTRIVVAILLLAIGLGFLGFAIFSALTPENGWVQIESIAVSSESVAGDLVFFYELGVSGKSINAEHRELSNLYTELCMDAYRLFTADYAFTDVHNLHYINSHVGEKVTVEPALYRALKAIEDSGTRLLFAAPFYREYKNLFADTEDSSAALVDPYKSEEIAAYFAELSSFTKDDAHICLEFLGENTVRLMVSEEYRAFAQENAIESYIDLYWARNAFAVDYICEELISRGFTYGSISSYDGFVRVMDRRETGYSYNLYGLYDDVLYNAARMDYAGSNSIVCLRSFPMTEQDQAYYVYKTGERRHPYVDATDGLCKNATDALVAYSPYRGCAAVLLAALPNYLSGTLDDAKLSEMASGGVYAAYAEGTTVYYTQTGVKLSNLYRDEKITFQTKEIGKS